MIEEFENGKLPKQEDWDNYIDSLRKQVRPSTKEEIKQALIKAVEKRIPKEKFGVFFSGGVDSSIIALILKKFTDNFACYSVGTEESQDLRAAEKTAKSLNVEYKHKICKPEKITEYFKLAKQWMPKPNVVNVGVGSVIIAAAELAKEDGITTFFGGLGSEEIFAGYQRHIVAEDVNEECWHGLHTTWERDLTRDSILGEKLGIKVLVPFMDEELVKLAMGIPGDRKINSENRKVILSEISEELGLLKEISWRKKLGAQYGSGFDKVLGKLAKKAKVTKNLYIMTHLT